jgi:hypothetical protein
MQKTEEDDELSIIAAVIQNSAHFLLCVEAHSWFYFKVYFINPESKRLELEDTNYERRQFTKLYGEEISNFLKFIEKYGEKHPSNLAHFHCWIYKYYTACFKKGKKIKIIQTKYSGLGISILEEMNVSQLNEVIFGRLNTVSKEQYEKLKSYRFPSLFEYSAEKKHRGRPPKVPKIVSEEEQQDTSGAVLYGPLSLVNHNCKSTLGFCDASGDVRLVWRSKSKNQQVPAGPVESFYFDEKKDLKTQMIQFFGKSGCLCDDCVGSDEDSDEDFQ